MPEADPSAATKQVAGGIRVIAVGVVRHPRTGALMVDEIPEPGTGRIVHRPPGGGIDYGERALNAVIREFDEEYGLQVRVGPLLGVLENVFMFGGTLRHSVMFAYATELADPDAYEFERLVARDAPHISAVWRPISGARTEFIAPGIEDLINKTTTFDESVISK